MNSNETKDPNSTIVQNVDGKTLLYHQDTFGKEDIYEVVDTFPLGYTFWNIGKNAPEGYIPLCRPAAVQPHSHSRDIDTESLKAIKAEGAQTILKAIHYGAKSLKEMKSVVQAATTRGIEHGYKISRYREAIPYLEKIPSIEYWSEESLWLN